LVTGIDREIGRIRQLLDERGLATKTIIIFTSDNGFFFGERGLADKWLMYEESIRVPLIVHDPRLPKPRCGSTVDQIALNIDIAPTLLDLSGVTPPAGMQGRSLVPLLRAEPVRDWRTDFFYEHHFGEERKPPIPATEGVRDAHWKYTRWTSADPVFEELFDLDADPGELRNLAIEDPHRTQLDRLRARWKELAEQVR
jgi:arylsulfatase A-like enzyme